MSYLSAAGGAFLEWMEGKVLPGADKYDILIAERPQYREMLDSLHWSLLNQGKLTEAEEFHDRQVYRRSET